MKVVNNIDWKRYGLGRLDSVPVSIIVNLTSTYVPYTSAGKQAISDEEEILKEVSLALMDVGRKTNQYISRKRKKYEKQTRRKTLLKYIPEVATAVSKLSGSKKDELEKNLLELVDQKYPDIAPGAKVPEEELIEETAQEVA